ncbi:MAG: DUF1992 domain-containing protein [Chloroflexi bacterium]|nr:DUF1992 domain-containing protein [Chloroflexota bacterium]
MDGSKITPQDWEAGVEKTIREAMERGEFDNLPGKGKPLDLSVNPHTPEDWQLAYKIMRDAGVAPDWVEQGKEIRAALDALSKWVDEQARWQRARAAQANALPIDRMIKARDHLQCVRGEVSAMYRARATELNKLIDVFNLKAPPGIPHFTRIRIDEEIEKYLDASTNP